MAGRWVVVLAAVAVVAAACASPPADVALQREEAVAPPTLPPTAAPEPGTWEPLDLATTAGAEAVWTGEEVLVFHRADPSPEAASLVHLDPDSGAVTEASLEGSPIAGSIVSQWTWTGRELLVWALVIEAQATAQGAAYDPASRTWRHFASAPVDTGTPWPQAGVASASIDGEVLVWSHGVAFDPVNGASRAMAVAPLTQRARSAVVRTTEQVLVWGGDGTNEGAAYDPATDTWTMVTRSPLPASDRPVAVWTDTEVLVWDSSAGAAYDPARDTWRTLPDAPVHGTAAAWSGRELLLPAGAAYDPSTDSWRTLPPPPLPVADQVTAVWTGEAMVVLGTTGSAVYRPSAEAAIDAVASSEQPTAPAGVPVQASPPPAAERSPTQSLSSPVIRTLAAAGTSDETTEAVIVRDTEGPLAAVWREADIAGTAPTLPDGHVGVVVIAREARSTCRSLDDVINVEIAGPEVVVRLDPDGEFVQPCPGPPGAHAWTAFAVAIPEEYAAQLTTADVQWAESASGQ